MPTTWTNDIILKVTVSEKCTSIDFFSIYFFVCLYHLYLCQSIQVRVWEMLLTLCLWISFPSNCEIPLWRHGLTCQYNTAQIIVTWSNVVIQQSSHNWHYTACEPLRGYHSIMYNLMVLVDKIPAVQGMFMVIGFFLNKRWSLSHRNTYK